MKLSNEIGSKLNLDLTKAILFYEGGNVCYASVHKVMKVEHKAVIGAGTALSIGELEESLSKLGKSVSEGFIPDNLIYSSSVNKIWWRKPGKETIFIRNEGAEHAFTVSHPGLVFALIGNSIRVFAVLGNKKPTADTELYHAPYFNINSSGMLCTGNAKLPDSIQSSAFGEWESMFFKSYFTHHSRPNVIKSKLSFVEFWKWLSETNKPFPESALYKTDELTVRDILE